MATKSGAYGANDTAVAEPSGAYSASDKPADAPPAGKLRRAADTGLALGRGIVAVPETAVGISDLITGGRTGKAVERLGVRFKDAKQVLTDFQSDEQKAADARVQQADGFLPTVGAMIENPSTIANAVAESAPSMLAGGAVSRGLVNKGVNGITAGAVGEGVVSAGQAAEQVRQEGPTGFLTPKQAALAATSGAATGVINRASGKLADKLGIGDVNTAMATGKLGGTTERGIAQRTAYGAINEGVLQELPQSMQEQALQNLALDKPVGEGVAEAGAAGMLVGNLTGGAFGAVSRGPQTPQIETDSPDVGAVNQPGAAPGSIVSEQGGGFAPSQEPPNPPAAPPPSAPSKAQAMGINPAAGPLSAGAAIAVDTGADVITQTQEVEKQKAEAKAKEKTKPGADGKKPEPEAPAPVQPVTPDPTAPITGPFTQAIHGAANVTPTPAPAVDPQGPATPEGVGAQPDAPAAPGVGADQGPQGESVVPAAVPEPVAAPVTQPPTQESINATQQSRQGETIDPETGEIIQLGAQGAGGDGGQRPEDALQPGADAKGPQPAPDQPAAPAAASTPPEGKPAAPTEPLDLGAHTAATSPHNDRPEPTQAQKEAGNYKKAHLVISGVGISVENPEGSVRSGTDADGKDWSNTMQWHYGYAKRTVGSDDEQQDVFVKPGTPLDYAGQVFVVDQIDPKTGKHDEYKSMVGAKSPMEARKAYMGHYAKDWKGLKNVTALTWDQWREWLQAPKGTAPAAPDTAQSPSPSRLETPAPSDAESAPGSPPASVPAPDRAPAPASGSSGPAAAAQKTSASPTDQAQPSSSAQVPGAAPSSSSQPSQPPVVTDGTPDKPAGKVVSTFYGKFGKGMAMGNAQMKAANLNKTADDRDRVTYTAEEHGDSKYENDWAVVGRETKAAPAETKPADSEKPPKTTVTPQIPNDPAVTYGLPTFASNGAAKSPETRKAPGAEVEAAYIQALNGKPFNSGLTLTAAKMSNAIREKNAVMLADVVNPDNKVSREAFRILTGVTLPKGLLATQNAVNAYLNTPAAPAPKPEIVVDKAEIRPYRKPDGSIGYEAIPISPPTPVVEPTPKAKPVASSNTIFTEDAAAAARARLKAKLGRLNSGLDPETMLDGITLAGYHIEKGARTFAAYAKAMIEDLGDGVKPYLKSWYMGVKYDPRAGAFDGMDGAAYVENFKEEKLGQDVSVGDWWYAIDNRTRSNVLAKLGIGNQAPDTPWGQLRRENQPKIEAYYAGLDTAAIEKTAEKADTAPNGSRDDATDSQPGVGQRDPGAVQGADGGRGTPAQQPAAPVDSGNLEAPQPTDAPEPAGPPAADAPGVRAPVADVGPGAGTAGRGNAGNGRTRAGGKGNSAAGARGRGAAGPAPAVKAPESVSPANPGPGDFSIDDPLKIIGGGQVARFEKNKAAIEMRNRLQDEGRMPTREEQTVLAGYTGWGSFGQELFQGSWAKPAPKSGWEARDKWLRENLGQKEWEGMQTSIINAHYTDPPTVLAMWDMVRRMGFTGGRTLEPSIGIGNFYGMMPADMVGRSQRAGIELDPLTGSMAQMLYPNANIQIKGYEASTTPDNFYDLVIGNWPFFEYGPADRRYNRLNPTLHDYFFLKAIDQTRPGGLVVGITSKGTMDKKGISARMEMARKAELVAAFRLPSGAFEEYAGTKVVTDIIILRKRKAPLGIVAGEGWIETKDHPTREGTPVAINEYFHKNPSHVIGEIDYGHGTTTFRPGLIVHRPADMMEQLRRIAEMVPEGAFLADQTAKHISYVANHTKDRTNSLVDTPQGLFVVHGEHMAPAGEILKYELKDPKATQKRVDELKALVKMRQLYGALIDAERGAQGADTQRTALRQAYEAFTKASGPMSKSFGLQYLRKLDDPFYPSLAALEIGIPDASGKMAYRPAKILSESTMRGARAIESPSVSDAFVLARNESVNPPIARIAEISGKPEAEVRKVLVESGAGYEMPNGDFAPADVYLSGNVRAKLREAKAAVEAGNKAVQRNVDALQKVVPADIPYYKIETQMGATWVPPSTYADFVGHMLGIREGIEVGFQAGAWKVDFPSAYNHRAEANSGFGSVNVKFKRLVRAAIANQTITVKEKDKDGREFVMDEETKEVNAKIADMRLKFGEWLWSDPVRRTALEAEYNEVRNAYADPKFDGSFLGFQGMALTLGRGPFNLREHQVNAIWRGLVTRKSLNAHEVGTGKTFTMGGIAVESRRYGIAKKPMLFAHNANSKSVAHEIQMMYPAAKVLYVDNLSKENLKTRMMQIANDDWDVIVMPHSIIDRIGFKEETLMAMAQEELNDLQTSAEEAAAEDNVTITDEMWEDEEELNKLRSVTAKQLVKQRLKILSTIHKLAQQASKEDSVAFEDMGVDMLLVDEAHEFKKPPIATRMKLKGLQTQTSNRSIALMFLTKYVRANNNGANVHLFTGTPITNTMTEVFHMMRYMMQEEMKEVALADWDGWFGSFAREVNDVELTSTGEYEAVTRLQSFINVPELRRMIGQYMDVVFSDDMPEMVPRSVNGKLFSDPTLTEAERAQLLNGRTEGAADRPYKKVVNESSDMSPDQLREFARVQRYANTWKNMSKKDRKTTMTMGAPESPIIHDGIANKASFDVRLVEAIANAGKEGSAEMDPHPDSKAARTIKNLLEIYRGHPQANQVVFMSQGMAKFVTRREGPVGMKRDVTYPAFSTMHDMIERLVAAGVPRDQIAAVDGSTSKDRRKEIADAMNTGQIRIVFGSTGSLGVGVNMQRNLRAMHHMDAPWMPGDLEQRNGRGHRQGNQWNTVLEFRYITDRLDGKRWQTLARKQKFITDFMKSKGDVRVIEGDVASEEEGDILSTFAEAAGDPRILLREKLKKTLEGLQSRERMHGIAQSDAAGTIKAEQRDIESMGRALTAAGPVVQSLSDLIEQQRGDGFTMTVKGKQYTKRADAVEALDKVAADMRTGDEVAVIGAYGPLQLYAQWYRFADAPFMGVSIPGSKLDVNANGMSLASLESGLRHRRDTEIPHLEAQIARAKERMEHARKVLAEPFHMADKLAKTRRQLEDMERDIEANPVAPPYWLRNGAPIDTEVYRDGKPFTVTGHRWSDRGWFVVGSDERGEVNIPYMQAKDAQGMPLYEEHEFSAPTLTNQPGWYLVTNDKGVTEPAPRKLTADNIKDLLSHNYTIVRAAPPTDAPTEAAPEIVKAATPAKAGPVADEYQRLRVGARHLGQMGFNSPDTRFARSNRTGGVHMDDAEAIIASVREALPTAPPIIALESIAQAPADLRKFIRDAGAQDDFEAAYHNGKIYVLPSNVGSATRLQFLLAHHEIRHHGLGAMLGPRKNAVMFAIHATNANVRAAAAEQVRKGYATSKVLATEEALADMPVAELVKLNGWDKIVAAVREWLRGAAMRLRRVGLGNVADAIEPSAWTDKDVAALIARAEGVSRGGSAKYATEGTVFGQDSDMPARIVNEVKDAIQRWTGADVSKAAPELVKARALKELRAALADDKMSTDDMHKLAYNWLAKSYEYAPASGRMIEDAGASPVVTAMNAMVAKRAAEGGKHGPTVLPWGDKFAVVVDGRVVDSESTMAEAVDSAKYIDAEFWRGNFTDIDGNDTGYARWTAQGPALFARGGPDGVTDKISTTTKTASNAAAHYRGLGLQALGRRQITEIYSGILPQLPTYNTLMAQMDADKNEAGAEADQIAQDWGKLKDERQLAELMHDATLAQMDPEKPLMSGDDPLTYDRLRDQFVALSPEARKVYVDARETYRTHHENVRQAIRDRIERSELRGQRKAELLQQMDDEFYKAIKGVYFPLARFGDYVVIVRDGTGKAVSVNRAETINEAEALQRSLRQAYPDMTVGKVLKSKEFNAGRDAVGRGFMQNLYEVLGKQDMDEMQRAEMEDMLGQLYLSALPDLSWAKHGIHRKGTPGFSQDARRAFAQNTFHGARYLAKVRYSDLLENELSDAQKQVDGMTDSESFDSVKAQQVIDEMVKRHDAAMNPAGNSLSTALTSLGFVFHLGLSPASAMVNLTQTALVAYPIMGAKWGFDKAAAALLKASQQAAANKNDISAALSPDEKRAYDEAVRSGVIDVTMAHDLAGISQGEDAKVSWKLRPVMRWASFLFHHAEKFNRQATFVAAYRLAREAGSNPVQAYDQAVKATYDGHFDYSNTNRPRIMQGNAVKVILLFKAYAQNMVYTLARQAYLSMKGKNQFERAQARKALGGLLAMHAAAAGVLGLPMVSTLLAAASMLGGDDDEPWDAEVALRNMLADALGDQAADVLARGLSRLTPWDISGRVGLDKLILPDIQEGLEGQRLGESAMAAALGPVAGIGVSLLKGLQEITDGNFARGLEAMAPSLLRGPARAVRYASEGAIDKTGKPIVEDVNDFGIVGQALGFSPSDVRLATEAKSAVHQADARLAKRRATLMRHYAMAMIAGDEEGAADAREDILAFNERNPARRINPLQMARSVATRRKQIAESQGGVYLPKTHRDAMEAGQFGMP